MRQSSSSYSAGLVPITDGRVQFDEGQHIATSGHSAPRSISALISSTRHAVIRGPNFTGLGYRPVWMPAHHVDLETGIGPLGARIE